MYETLGLAKPTIVYTVLHQRKQDVETEEYRAVLFDLYNLVGQQWTELSSRLEANERAGLGALSWAEHAFSIYHDGLEQWLASGRDYLGSLGMDTGADAPEIEESVFTFEGAAGYDILEHIVRDSLGVYAPPHGIHIQQHGPLVFGTYDRIHDLPGDRGGWQAVFAFNKGRARYGAFRKSLRRTVEALAEETNWGATVAWQRKLGLGYGREFVLRVELGDQPERLAEVVREIDEKGMEPAKSSIVRFGKAMLAQDVSA
jgi:hypothetical protein